VKFWVTTPSGGTDSFIAVIDVGAILGPHQVFGAQPLDQGLRADGPNPSREVFRVVTPLVPGITARLTIFDLSGRRVALVSGPSRVPLVWDGRDEQSGLLAAPGVYFYRLEAGSHRRDGKVAVVR